MATRAGVFLTAASLLLVARPAPAQAPDIELFFAAASPDEQTSREALNHLAPAWRDGYTGLLIDLARFLPRPGPAGSQPDGQGEEGVGLPGRGPGEARPAFLEAPTAAASSPRGKARERLLRFLEARTGQRFGQDLRAWRRWSWGRRDELHPRYAPFKAALYGAIDPRMAVFFVNGRPTVRLDEIDWGGVAPNGIPPLDHPKTLSAAQAGYLDDRDVVFGLDIGGETRAYPRRILGWHEVARDRLGGREITVVYCTLCGTVVPFASEVGGSRRTFGTSGLLYRSNKLLFDEESMSLWNSTDGTPVAGPLAGSGLRLTDLPVVTTRWRAWVEAHPDTTVLSLETGHRRDYSEGAAYREYFSNDRLMFEVPQADRRLKNKDEILGLLLPADGDPQARPLALAFSVSFLKSHPVHHQQLGTHRLVVVTTPDGANRVFDSGPIRFGPLRDGRLDDEEGRSWRMDEEALVSSDGAERRLRLPARRAFWFGWYAQFPDTVLVR